MLLLTNHSCILIPVKAQCLIVTMCPEQSWLIQSFIQNRAAQYRILIIGCEHRFSWNQIRYENVTFVDANRFTCENELSYFFYIEGTQIQMHYCVIVSVALSYMSKQKPGVPGPLREFSKRSNVDIFCKRMWRKTQQKSKMAFRDPSLCFVFARYVRNPICVTVERLHNKPLFEIRACRFFCGPAMLIFEPDPATNFEHFC